MGSGLLVECKNCDYNDEFLYGIGMMYVSLDNVLDTDTNEEHQKIKELLVENSLENKPNLFENPFFEQRIYECKKCHKRTAKLYVKIIYGEDQVYETTFTCSKCKKTSTI